MSFSFVQMLLALLFTYVSYTTQDLERGNLAIEPVRQVETRLNPTNVNNLDLIELRKVHFQPEVALGDSNGDEGRRRKRSLAVFTYRMSITDTINNLRSYAGASDMNYLTYSRVLAGNAANWTSHCDPHATVYVGTKEAYVAAGLGGSPPDQVSFLTAQFNSSNFYYGLRSVELRSNGAAYSLCYSLRYNGKNYTDVYLAVYLFSCTRDFNASVQQYTLGEACTTCRSGRYWCYKNLCKNACSASDSYCYCNSYCLNCADTNSTTCRCVCLDGWSGLRCNTSDGHNVTTPTCSTTPRVPITWSTTGPTTVALKTTTRPTAITLKITTSPSTVILETTTRPTTVALKTTKSLKNVAQTGKPMIQLSLYAIIALFLSIN